jgi:hypothetical protein
MTAHVDRHAGAGRCRTQRLTPTEAAIMLTLPVEAGRAAANRPARILVIGRNETVLSEAVTILREKGYAAGRARTSAAGSQPASAKKPWSSRRWRASRLSQAPWAADAEQAHGHYGIPRLRWTQVPRSGLSLTWHRPGMPPIVPT